MATTTRMLSGLTALAASLVLALGTPTSPAVADGRTLFITSAVEDGQGHATLPLHRGTSQLPTGQAVTVDFIILDTSSGDLWAVWASTARTSRPTPATPTRSST
jgi:hypothetical protein